MLFNRKTFMDVIRLMNPYGGKLYFRDSEEKGTFEVISLKESKYCGNVLVKAVFRSENAGIFSDDVDVIGEPFYADARNVLAALAGKEVLAEYRDGLFDGVSVDRHIVSAETDDPAEVSRDRRELLRRELRYYDEQEESEPGLTIPAGQHRILARNIKDFPSDEESRYTMNTYCIHFSAQDDIRIVATDGKAMAVYRIADKFDEALAGMWTVSPDMFLVPPYNYESAIFSFSRESVSMSVRGGPDDPVITVYDVALEWRDLKELRFDVKKALASGDKTQEEADEDVRRCIEKGAAQVFPNYIRVIPDDNTEKMILDRDEIMLGLEKLKRSLYHPRWGQSGTVFVIDALDPKNIFLTSVTDMDDNWGMSYIDTALPLKKAEVTRPLRVAFTKECFVRCCLEGNDKIEFKYLDAKKAFVAEGIDFCKGRSVNVKKIFMPFSIPAILDNYGVAPEKPKDTEAAEESQGSENED